MSDEVSTFSPATASRIVRATRFVEGIAQARKLPDFGDAGFPDRVRVLQATGLTTIGGTVTLDPGVYQASVLLEQVGSLTLTGGTLTAGSLTTGGGSLSAYYVSLPEIGALTGGHTLAAATDGSGTMLVGLEWGVAGDGKPVYVGGGGGGGGDHFTVKVKVNGSDSHGPTYDLYNKNDTTSKLNGASALEPYCSRARVSSLLTPIAPADYSFGTAYIDDTGAIGLWDLPETVDKDDCS